MSYLLKSVDDGINGVTFGLPTGIEQFDEHLGGVHMNRSYLVFAPEKMGKTKLLRKMFVYSPFEYWLSINPKDRFKLSIPWDATEIALRDELAESAVYFMVKENGGEPILSEDGKHISAEYLLGMKRYQGERLIVSKEHREMVREVDEKYLKLLFGEYDEKRRLVDPKQRIVIYVDNKDNPTGFRNRMRAFAGDNGTLEFDEHKKLVNYVPNREDHFVIIILDHARNMNRERGFTEKENVDKVLRYIEEDRNILGFCYAITIHSGRQFLSIENRKISREFLHPRMTDVMDSSVPGQSINYGVSLMDPADEFLQLERHFGRNPKAVNARYGPHWALRTMHLVAARGAASNQHWGLLMNGAANDFKDLK